MKTRWMEVLGLVGLAAVATSLPACAADTESDDLVDEADADLTARQLSGVAAVEIANLHLGDVTAAKTVGAPKKVKILVATPKKLKPNAPVPRCLAADRTRLTYLDASGTKLATLDTSCGSYGYLNYADGRAGYMVKLDGSVVSEAKDAPFAVGDALWGISTIEISKPGQAQAQIALTGQKMVPVLIGFDLNAIPDGTAPMPRCLPSYAVTFKRANDAVASSSFLCGNGDAPASVKAHFSAVDLAGGADADPLANGAISIDPRPIIDAYGSRN